MKTKYNHHLHRVSLLVISFFITLLLLFAVNFLATAQTVKPPIVTDRPDQTESSSLVPKGGLQVETGFVYEEDQQENIHLTNVTYNTTLIKYGVNENFELRFISEYVGEKSRASEKITSNVKGIAPFALGLKIRLADEKGIWPKAALIGHVYSKSGSEEFTTNYTASDFRFTFSNTLSDKINLSYNLGAEWNGNSPEVSFLYTLSLAYSVSDKMGFFIESYSFFPEESKADHRFDLGITWLFSPVVQWDLSGGIGLSKNAPDSFVSTGLSFRLFK